jgi:hypothetical protein
MVKAGQLLCSGMVEVFVFATHHNATGVQTAVRIFFIVLHGTGKSEYTIQVEVSGL